MRLRAADALDAIQNSVIDAYLDALTEGIEPRFLASHIGFVTGERKRARQLAIPGLRLQAEQFRLQGHHLIGDSLDAHIATFDLHLGSPQQVSASVKRDSTLARVTDLSL